MLTARHYIIINCWNPSNQLKGNDSQCKCIFRWDPHLLIMQVWKRTDPDVIMLLAHVWPVNLAMPPQLGVCYGIR